MSSEAFDLLHSTRVASRWVCGNLPNSIYRFCMATWVGAVDGAKSYFSVVIILEFTNASLEAGVGMEPSKVVFGAQNLAHPSRNSIS